MGVSTKTGGGSHRNEEKKREKKEMNLHGEPLSSQQNNLKMFKIAGDGLHDLGKFTWILKLGRQ